MFKCLSKRAKNALEFLFWFYLFTYVPIIPAYFIMSLKGVLGLLALVYVALSISLIFKIYINFEKYKNMKKTVVAM